MDLSWGVLAPLIAIVITIAAMQAAVVLTGAIRRHDYRRFEDKSADSLAREFPLPTLDSSPAAERRRSLSPFLDEAHKAASAAQTSYHNAVARSEGCLMLAFLAMVFGTLAPEDWPFRARLTGRLWN
jgi:hypothetical protein